jgi:hypothetical protein
MELPAHGPDVVLGQTCRRSEQVKATQRRRAVDLESAKRGGLFSLTAGGRKETDAGRTASERSDSSSPSPSSNPTAHCSQTTSSV